MKHASKESTEAILKRILDENGDMFEAMHYGMKTDELAEIKRENEIRRRLGAPLRWPYK